MRAALLDDVRAREAWEQWRDRVNLDDVDYPSHGLLPLVYRNLSQLGVHDPDLGRMKGCLRRTLYVNHLLFAAAGNELTALHAAGIETLLLKGAPLAILHYGSPGLRPMADVDILVPTSRALAAIRLLRERGWKPVDTGTGRPEDVIGLRHSEGFQRSDGAMIDLHWNALLQPFRDDDLWACAVDVELGGVPTRAPCPTDQLLLVVVHSLLHGESDGSLRWVADSTMLLRSAGPNIDWDRLVDAARRRAVTLPMTSGLAYLRTFNCAVPEGVISELARSPARRLERAAFHAIADDPSRWRTVKLIADRHTRLRRLDTPFQNTPGFVTYLVRSLGYPTRRRLIAVTVRTTARRSSELLRQVVRRKARHTPESHTPENAL